MWCIWGESAHHNFLHHRTNLSLSNSISKLPLFQVLKDDELRKVLGKLTLVTVDDGDMIIQQVTLQCAMWITGNDPSCYN